MLPGFRFLFAAVLLTVSLVVFGLGAAALLRSAHQEFATIPTRRAPPTVFAQPPVEAPPTLAMLRVEAAAPTPETVAPPAVSVTSAAEQEPPSRLLRAGKIALPETAAPPSTPATAAVEITAPVAATPKPEVAAKSEPTKIEEREPLTTVAVAPATFVEPVAAPPPEAATVPAPAAAAEVVATPAGPQPTATLTDDDARLSSTKIAMLGGPPIDTESVPLPKAKPAAEPAKKIVKKHIVVKKRRVAARPMAAAAPQPTDPFGLPVAR